MATRFKTIEYVWDNVVTATAETTMYTSGDITINIPETASRVFKFVLLELTVHDNEGTVADDLSVRNMGVSCNGGTNWTDRNISNALADTAENMSYIWTADVTAEFVARFSGSSNTTTRFRTQMDYASTGNQFLNIGAKLIITYAYDDAGVTTQIKTVRIPIQSNNSRLSNTAADIGGTGSQIPLLNSYLPEAGKVFRDIFFELWTNTQPSGTAPTPLNLSLGSETEISSGSFVNTSQSPILYRHIWKRSDLTTFGSAAHVIKARHILSGSSLFSNIGGWLTATYEYDVSSTGSVMNSLVFGIAEEDGPTPPVAEIQEYTKLLWIEEPGPITLVDSGVFITANPSATSTVFNCRIGSGAQQALLGSYTSNAQTGQAGMSVFMHKFGSGYATPYGSGLTLNRGQNFIDFAWYSATATRYSNLSAIAILNYISGVMPGGSVESHNKSVMYLGSPTMDTQRAAATRFTWVGSYDIPETNYFLNGITFVIDTNNAATVSAAVLSAESNAGEGNGSGLNTIYVGLQLATSERMPYRNFGLGRKIYKRYPTDPDSERLNVESARTYTYETLLTGPLGVYNWITYHTINYSIAGSVGSYAGAGSNIPVYAYKSVNRELIGSTLTGAGGAYSIVWYDNVGSVYTEARESNSKVGRSPDGLAE